MIALLALIVNLSNAQDLDEVLASHFEAINQDAISKVESMIIKGKSGRMGQSFPFEISQKRPGNYRMEVDIQGQKMIQTYNGKTAYMTAPWTGSIEAQEMGETETNQMKEQADMDGQLWNWKEKGSQVTLEGIEEFEGAEVIILKLINDQGNETKYFLDADSYLPIKTVAKVQMQGAEVEVEAFMSNYKEVNDMVVAFYMEQRMKGEIISTITIEEIIVNPELPDDMFEKTIVKEEKAVDKAVEKSEK